MQVKKLISRNPDIYDGLFDLYGIDLKTCTSIADVLSELDTLIKYEETAMKLTEEIHGGKNITAERELFALTTIKGFINTMLYRETEQCEDDDFFESVFELADESYKPIAGRHLPLSVQENFIALDIRNIDDLYDNEYEFDSLELVSFENALETLESFERR